MTYELNKTSVSPVDLTTAIAQAQALRSAYIASCFSAMTAKIATLFHRTPRTGVAA